MRRVSLRRCGRQKADRLGRMGLRYFCIALWSFVCFAHHGHAMQEQFSDIGFLCNTFLWECREEDGPDHGRGFGKAFQEEASGSTSFTAPAPKRNWTDPFFLTMPTTFQTPIQHQDFFLVLLCPTSPSPSVYTAWEKGLWSLEGKRRACLWSLDNPISLPACEPPCIIVNGQASMVLGDQFWSGAFFLHRLPPKWVVMHAKPVALTQIPYRVTRITFNTYQHMEMNSELVYVVVTVTRWPT